MLIIFSVRNAIDSYHFYAYLVSVWFGTCYANMRNGAENHKITIATF